jgi:site-specific recombinase
MASFIGSVWFGLMLGLAGLIAGFVICKKRKI